MTDLDTLPEIIEMPLDDFLKLQPAPGHRDSGARAFSATHLHKLLPEHLDVEIAIFPDSNGTEQRRLLTGNTRKFVWLAELSDKRPTTVRARVFRYENEDGVRAAMLRHDSQEQAWTTRDYKYRAWDMAFGAGWRPRSKALNAPGLVSAIRNITSIVYDNRMTPDPKARYELLMRKWTKELALADQLLDVSMADAIKQKKPLTSGFLSAILLLLRYRQYEEVEPFIHGILSDNGRKTEEGMDGVFVAIENLGRKGDDQDQLCRGIIGSFVELWEKKATGTVGKSRKFDSLAWVREEREKKRVTEREMRAAAE